MLFRGRCQQAAPRQCGSKARPCRECDQAAIHRWVSGCPQQEDAECDVKAHHHRQRWLLLHKQHQGINHCDKEKSHQYKHDLQRPLSTHGASSQTLEPSTRPATLGALAANQFLYAVVNLVADRSYRFWRLSLGIGQCSINRPEIGNEGASLSTSHGHQNRGGFS